MPLFVQCQFSKCPYGFNGPNQPTAANSSLPSQNNQSSITGAVGANSSTSACFCLLTPTTGQVKTLLSLKPVSTHKTMTRIKHNNSKNNPLQIKVFLMKTMKKVEAHIYNVPVVNTEDRIEGANHNFSQK
jgi:hypothetical protein